MKLQEQVNHQGVVYTYIGMHPTSGLALLQHPNRKVKPIEVSLNDIQRFPFAAYSAADVYTGEFDRWLYAPIDALDEDRFDFPQAIQDVILKADDDAQAAVLLKEAGLYEKFKEEVEEKMAKSDLSFEYQCVFEDMVENIRYWIEEVIKRKGWSKRFVIYGSKMGWRGKSGYQYKQYESAQDLISGISPQCDCSFEFYDEGDYFTGTIWHHDAPTGEGRSIHFLEELIEERLSFNDMRNIIRTTNNNYGYVRYEMPKNKKQAMECIVEIVDEEGIEITGLV